MRRLRKKGRRAMSQINVVPYIDVMLVLLIIFMITAPLLTQGVQVSLPNAKANPIPLKRQEPIVVSVDKAGRYYVNVSPTPDVPVDAQQLLNLVAAEEVLAKQENRNRPVFVKGDQDANYGKVVAAMVLLQRAGAKSIGLLTKIPPREKHET